MELCSASKSGGVEGWRKTTMMPVRVHEILGLPMSGSKTGKPHRSEPVRVKQLLELMESSSKPKMNFPARRITVAPSGTGKVRRQLYSEAVDETLPDTSIIEGSHASAENSVKKLINITSTEKSRAVRLGLSKSDGKVKLNDQRLQPVRVKLLMESWEKSQTAKRAGKKSVTGNLRSINVRRKLYSVVPSPVASHKVSKKSLAPNKPQEQVNTLQKSQMAFKPNAEKSLKITQQKSRKSCLLPPNSIRDKHISLQTKDTIIEESPTSLFSENNENSSVNKQEIKVATAPDIHKIASLPAAELPSNSLQAVDSVVASSSQKSEKLFDSNVEIPRPTVIMGFATSSVSKNRNQSVSSDCSSKSAFVLSHPPLEELNKNSTMPLQRIDAADTSLQDLLGTSETDRQIFEPRSSFLPYNSFLLNCESNKSSLAQIDKKTLLWLRGNMKLSIQTTEESLFSMKQMLKTIDDIINNSEHDKNPAEIDDYVSAELPKILVEDTDFIEEKENDSFANSLVHEDEIFQGKTKEDIDENLAEDKENLIEENCNPVEEDKEKENGEKTRRRSARLAAIKALSVKNPDDSFSRIEKELNITHEKSMKISPDKMTPAKKKSVDPRNRKSLREYMALKSCAKFLQTPDHKGLPTPKCEKTGTPAERRATERALSRRVLNQLHNLYDESPE